MKIPWREVFLRTCPFLTIILANVIFGLYNKESLLISLFFFHIPSVIIVYCFYMFFLFLTKKRYKTNIIIIVFYAIFLVINQIKIYYTHEPIYLSDILLLGGFKEITSFAKGSIMDMIKSYFGIFLLQNIVFGIIIYFLLKKKEEPIKRRFYFLIPLILLSIISLPLESTTNLARKIMMFDETNDYAFVTSDIEYSLYYGLVGGIYGNMLNERVFKPSDYDEEELKTILDTKMNLPDQKKIHKPNIIVILSESFFDITNIKDISFTNDPLKDYHEMAKNHKLLKMITPSYGGMTANVEFSLFTGYNLAYNHKSYIPYLKMVNQDFAKKDNFIKMFNDNGYHSYVFKAFSDELYNEKVVYNYLGFQNKVMNDATKDAYKGGYLSDNFITKKVIELLEKSDEPVFYFLSTMQNHMPYSIDKYHKYDVEIQNSKLNKEDNEVILSYTQGLYDASYALKELDDYLKKSKEDTLVIFFGDHLPFLSDQNGRDILKKTSYLNDDDNKINLYHQYQTEALLLANFYVNYDNTQYLSYDLLLPYVLKSLEFPINTPYNYLINQSQKILASYNRYIAMDNLGNLYYTSELEEDMLKEYRLRNNLQYKLFYAR